MIEVFISALTTRLKRQLRRPGLWTVALAAPLAAHFLVPEPGASYAILSVNDRFLDMDGATLGLQLGVITATLLLPLAYIYLRIGQARREPWPLFDASPHPRPAYTLGTWAADTLTLWSVLGALVLAGIVLAVFRFPEAARAPHHIAFALALIGAPAMALTAALVTLFEARPWLRRWPGDVVFFFAWMFLIVIGVAPSSSGGAMQPLNAMADPLGFVPVITAASPEPVVALTIGSGPAASGTLKINALQGLMANAYPMSRALWIALSGGIAFFAGLVFAPHGLPKSPVVKRRANELVKAIPFAGPARAAASPVLHQIVSDLRGLFVSRAGFGLLALAAFAGAILPFRTLAAPAIFLLLIFPLAAAGARWQPRDLQALLTATLSSVVSRAVTLCIAGTLAGLIAFTPALMAGLLTHPPRVVSQAFMISAGTALTATLLGLASKSAVPARLVLLGVWYAYLSSA